MTDLKNYRLRSDPRWWRARRTGDLVVICVAIGVLPYVLGFLARAFWIALLAGWRVLG